MSSTSNYFHFAWFWIFLTLAELSVAAPAVLDSGQNRISLAHNLTYISDPKGQISLNQILSDTSLEWQKSPAPHFRLWIDPGAYWLKYSIKNPYKTDKTLLLELEHPTIDRADLFQIDSKNTIKTLYENMGLDTPFANRPMPYRNIITSVTLPAGSQTTFVWHISSEKLFRFHATIWQADAFFARHQHVQMLYGLMYGVVFALILYNTFLFFSTKDRVFYYFVVFVLSTGYLISAIEGHLYQYLGANYVWPKQAILAIVSCLNLFMFSKFIISFLDLRHRAPILRKTIHILSLLVFLCVFIAYIVNDSKFLFVLFTVIALFYASTFVAAFKCRMKGMISAGHIVLGLMLQSFAYILVAMAVEGSIAVTTLIEATPAIGAIAMLIFFALALSDRINALQFENRRAVKIISKARHDSREAAAALAKSQQELRDLEFQSEKRQIRSDQYVSLSEVGSDISAPLTNLLSSLQSLLSSASDVTQFKRLKQIEQAGRGLLCISDDFRHRTAINNAENPVEFVPFNVEQLIENCITAYTYQVKSKNLLMFGTLGENVPAVVRGDINKIRHIIIALLKNAVAHTESGPIILSVEQTNRASINSIELKFTLKSAGQGAGKAEQELRHDLADDEYTNGTDRRHHFRIHSWLIHALDGQHGVGSDGDYPYAFWFTARLLLDNERAESHSGDQWPVELHEKRVAIFGAPDELLAEISRRLNQQHMHAFIPSAEQSIDASSFDVVIFCNEHQLETAIVREHLALPAGIPLLILCCSSETTSADNVNPYTTQVIEQPFSSESLRIALLQLLAPNALEINRQNTAPHPAETITALIVDVDPACTSILTTLLDQLGVNHDYISVDTLPEVVAAQQPHCLFYSPEKTTIDIDMLTELMQSKILEARPPVPVAVLKDNAQPVLNDDILVLKLPATAADMQLLLDDIESRRSEAS